MYGLRGFAPCASCMGLGLLTSLLKKIKKTRLTPSNFWLKILEKSKIPQVCLSKCLEKSKVICHFKRFETEMHSGKIGIHFATVNCLSRIHE